MAKRFRLFKPGYPHLDWIQVEISSECNRACAYCPKTAYHRSWQPRLLPLPAFEALLPAFENVRLVFLQGWGEPFAHPGFFEMLRMAKSVGCAVGTTTNATLLTEDMLDRLVDEGIDVVAFSLAGITRDTNRTRGEDQFDAVCEAIRYLQNSRAERKRSRPAIHIAHMLLRSNLDELDRMPDFFSELLVDQAVVSSLSLVAHKELIPEAVLADSLPEWEALARRISAVRQNAAEKGVDLHFRLVSPFKLPQPCDENIEHALFVRSDGKVSPCVMTNLPVIGKNPHYSAGKPVELPHVSFGNVFDTPLPLIWHSPEYRQFRRSFSKGVLPSFCRNCCKSTTVALA